MPSPGSVGLARRREMRLVPVAAVAWAVAAAAILHPELAHVGAVALWAGCVVVTAVTARAGQPARTRWALIAIALAAAAACATHVAAAQPLRAAAAALEVDGGRALTLDVTAVGKIEPGADGWRFDAMLRDARLGASERGAHFGEAGVPVLVRISDVPEGLDLGADLRLAGTAWRADAGERAVLVIDATGVPEVTGEPSGALAAASALRRGLVGVTATLPQPGGGLIAGLAVGDTSGVDADLDAAMKTSSLSHLTAVSGANCALVVMIAFGAAALCRARRGMRVGVALGALIAFVVLVSPEPSVVRAGAMAAIAMLGVLLGRPGAGLSLLTTAVLILLVIDPWLALSLGFALSTAATAALLVGAGPLADGLSRWMPRPLALAISVPLAAQLACGPLIVLIAPQLSVYGVVANLVAAPAAPLGTVIGLVACLGAGVPLLGGGLAALAWLPAAWIASTATTFAALPGATMPWPEGAGGLIALSVLGAAVAVVIAPAPARARGIAVLLLAAAAGAALAAGPIADVLERARIPSQWAIVACDVGQGDAVLLRSAGRVALVDTGPDPDLLRRCLDTVGVSHIDLLVLTHFDLDHRGGVEAVRGRVGVVLHGPPGDAADAALVDDLAAAGARTLRAARGTSGTLGESRWRVLWPGPEATPGNDASIVLDWRGGGVPASLLLGDLSAAGQQAMTAGAPRLRSYDVVKVAHHGSADQSFALYRRISPAVALVTVGENDYGHPRAEILDLLSNLGTHVARTDQEGLLALWRSGEQLRVWRERAPAATDVDVGAGR